MAVLFSTATSRTGIMQPHHLLLKMLWVQFPNCQRWCSTSMQCHALLRSPAHKSGHFIVVSTSPGSMEVEWWPGVVERNICVMFWGDYCKNRVSMSMGNDCWGHLMRYAKWDGGVEPNRADKKTNWHAWRTACDFALGVHIQQWVPTEWVDVYVLWIK
jgi:hypothetical protein